MTLNNKGWLSVGVRRCSQPVLFVVFLSVVSSAQAQKDASSRGWAVNTTADHAVPVENSVAIEADAEERKVTPKKQSAIQSTTELEIEALNEVEILNSKAGATFVENDVAGSEKQPTTPDAPTFIGVSSEPIQDESEFVDTLVEKSVIESTIALKPSIDLNLEFNETLKLQFQAIQELAETEDSYSERFGELYMAYARSLLKVGRLDEARKMFANALHNAKINNGVNGLEQRPILRELFEMSLAIGNVADAEGQLKRLIWLDRTVPHEDTYTFDLILQLANYYLDQYLMTPSTTEVSLIALYKSIRYYGFAIRRYNDTPLKYQALPYGDLAYAHFLKSRVRSRIDDGLYLDARKRSYTNLDKHDSRIAIDHSFSQSDHYLRQAYKKAKEELDFEGTLQTLLALGDLHLLYGNADDANVYYQLARKGAEHLPLQHPIVESFRGAVELPAFELSVERDPLSYGQSYQIVPISLDIDINGYTSGIKRQKNMDIPMGIRIRAKKVARQKRFRPIIEQGKLAPVADHHYDVQVPIRGPVALANKELEE